MRPTIYTVAEKAGVSIATVSRVLNGHPLVKAETRAKVLHAVEALGYQPRASARSLALNSTETIALIFPRVSGPFFSEIIQGAEVEARQYQYHLLIYSVHTPQDNERLLRFLSAKVDGLILPSSCVSDAYVRELQQQRIPFVLLGRGKQIATRSNGLGNRRVTCITAIPKPYESIQNVGHALGVQLLVKNRHELVKPRMLVCHRLGVVDHEDNVRARGCGEPS